jgi:hypothetical protein
MKQLAWSVPVPAERDTREPLDDHTTGGVFVQARTMGPIQAA